MRLPCESISTAADRHGPASRRNGLKAMERALGLFSRAGLPWPVQPALRRGCCGANSLHIEKRRSLASPDHRARSLSGIAPLKSVMCRSASHSDYGPVASAFCRPHKMAPNQAQTATRSARNRPRISKQALSFPGLQLEFLKRFWRQAEGHPRSTRRGRGCGPACARRNSSPYQEGTMITLPSEPGERPQIS